MAVMVFAPMAAKLGSKVPAAASTMPVPDQVSIPPVLPVTLACRSNGAVVAFRQISATGVGVTVTVGQFCAVQVCVAVLLPHTPAPMASTVIVTDWPGVSPVTSYEVDET